MRARIGKRIILDTTHDQLLFEDERHPWRAVPKDALLAPLAGPAAAASLDGCWCPHRTTCQYKGQACYWTVDGTNPPLPVWSYPEPLPEAASLVGLIRIPDDDPAVQLLINDAPARHENAG